MADPNLPLNYTPQFQQSIAPAFPPPPPQSFMDQQNKFQQLLGAIQQLKQSRNRSILSYLPTNERSKYQSSVGQAPIRFTGAWNDLVNQAKQVANQYGIPPAVMVGQMALESGRGTSNFAKNKNNLFGMGAYDSNPDNAFSYQTPTDSMKDYANLLTTSPRYKDALQYPNDPYKFLQAVKSGGYATDENYVNKVASTPEFKQLSGL